MKIKLQLLKLWVMGLVTWNYIQNYDYSPKYILVANKVTDAEPYTMLLFHEDLKLIGKDTYKIIGSEEILYHNYVDGIIHKPKHRALYYYNIETCEFELLLAP